MTPLVAYILLFLAVGVGFIFVHLVAGKLIRPARPSSEKGTIYECGEPTIGTAWVQFDLRFYVVALLFVIFDVEVAFFFPWALVFGKANALSDPDLKPAPRAELSAQLLPKSLPPVPALADPAQAQVIEPATAGSLAWLAFWDILVFFGVLLVGFAYLWRRGDLDWVRTTVSEQLPPPRPPPEPAAAPKLAEAPGEVLVSSGH